MTHKDDDKALLAGPRDPTDDSYRPQPRRRGGSQRQSVGEAAAKAFIRSIASSLGRMLARAITGRMR